MFWMFAECFSLRMVHRIVQLFSKYESPNNVKKHVLQKRFGVVWAMVENEQVCNAFLLAMANIEIAKNPQSEDAKYILSIK